MKQTLISFIFIIFCFVVPSSGAPINSPVDEISQVAELVREKSAEGDWCDVIFSIAESAKTNKERVFLNEVCLGEVRYATILMKILNEMMPMPGVADKNPQTKEGLLAKISLLERSMNNSERALLEIIKINKDEMLKLQARANGLGNSAPMKRVLEIVKENHNKTDKLMQDIYIPGYRKALLFSVEYKKFIIKHIVFTPNGAFFTNPKRRAEAMEMKLKIENASTETADEYDSQTQDIYLDWTRKVRAVVLDEAGN